MKKYTNDLNYKGWAYRGTTLYENDNNLYLSSRKNNIFKKYNWLFQFVFGVMLVTMMLIVMLSCINFLHYYLFINPFLAIFGVGFFIITFAKMYAKQMSKFTLCLELILIPLRMEKVKLSKEEADNYSLAINEAVTSGDEAKFTQIMSELQELGLEDFEVDNMLSYL